MIWELFEMAGANVTKLKLSWGSGDTCAETLVALREKAGKEGGNVYRPYLDQIMASLHSGDLGVRTVADEIFNDIAVQDTKTLKPYVSGLIRGLDQLEAGTYIKALKVIGANDISLIKPYFGMITKRLQGAKRQYDYNSYIRLNAVNLVGSLAEINPSLVTDEAHRLITHIRDVDWCWCGSLGHGAQRVLDLVKECVRGPGVPQGTKVPEANCALT